MQITSVFGRELDPVRVIGLLVAADGQRAAVRICKGVRGVRCFPNVALQAAHIAYTKQRQCYTGMVVQLKVR